MGFFDVFYTLTVVEEKGVVTVSGVKHLDRLIARLEKMMSTSRVGTYLFTAVNRTKMSFYSFHVLDVIYLLNRFHDTKFIDVGVSKSTLKSIVRELEANTWVRNTFKTYPTILDQSKLQDFNVSPLPHQTSMFEFYDSIVQKHTLNGTLVAAAAGSGKTLLSLFLQRMLPVDTVIIVCPLPTLVDVWVKTMETFFVTKPTYWYSRQPTAIPMNVEYIIVHYEYLNKLINEHKLPLHKRYGVILDESHNFTGASNRSELLYELCKQVHSKHTLWLSGTPIRATALEVMPLLRVIDPLFTPNVEARARKAFAGTNTAMSELLGSRLNNYMRKVEKDVLGLPPVIEHKIDIVLKNGTEYTQEVVVRELKAFIVERSAYYAKRSSQDKQAFLDVLTEYEKTLTSANDKHLYKMYRSDLAIVVSKNGFIMEIPEIVRAVNVYELKTIMPKLSTVNRQKFKDVRALYKYPSLKVVGEALGQVLMAKRIRCFVDMAKAIDFATIVDMSESKTLVFASNVEVVDAAGNKCVSQKLSPVLVYGDKGTPIPQAVEMMDKDVSKDPLITTYKSLSTGVPLIMCSSVVLVNLPWRPHELNQAIARVWRLGQLKQVQVYKVSLDTGDLPNLSTRTTEVMTAAQTAVKELTGLDYGTETEEIQLDGVTQECLSADLFMEGLK